MNYESISAETILFGQKRLFGLKPWKPGSRSVYQAMKGLKSGMSEIEASRLLGLNGEPLTIHSWWCRKSSMGVALK